jgi:hypothetical protein
MGRSGADLEALPRVQNSLLIEPHADAEERHIGVTRPNLLERL